MSAGSNTLIRDKGIRGVVIKLGSGFSEMKLIDKDIIEAGSASLDRKVSDFAKKNCISNFEFLSCIPGSIGGAVIMNSGCYGYDISKILISLKVIDTKALKKKRLNVRKLIFIYRGTNLQKILL